VRGAPEETPTDTGRTCKLHTNSDSRPGLNPSPWHCEAAVLTTVPPLQDVPAQHTIFPATDGAGKSCPECCKARREQ